MYTVKRQTRILLVFIMLVPVIAACKCAPSSQTLLYEHKNALWKMYGDGSDKIKLVDNANNPCWIPGTKDKIAFVRFKATKTAIFVADSDGKNEKQLTPYNAGEHFSWSPDRNWIAFQSDRDGNWEIYKVNVNSSQEVRLTNNKFDDTRPRWSPKGDKIAFESNRRNWDWDIWVMDTTGKSLQNLTDGVVGDGYDGRAVWSTHGDRIAHFCNHVGWGGPKICLAFLGKPSSTGPFSEYGSDQSTEPLWSPSEDYIFYVDYQAGRYTLYKQESQIGKKSQVLSSGWSTSGAGTHIDANETTLYFGKGLDLYSVKWRVGGEKKLGEGYNPDVW